MRITSFVTGVLAVIFVVTFWTQVTKDAPIPAARWLWPAIVVQDELAREPDERPSLIIIAGSNALFGFDGAALETLTGLKVANLSSHVGLPLSFHRKRLENVIKPGDVVVMPLELAYYSQAKATKFEHIQNAVWLHSAYEKASPLKWLSDNWQSPSEIMLKTLASKIFQKSKYPIETDRDKVIREWRQSKIVSNGQSFYNANNIDRWGGLYIAGEPQARAKRLIETDPAERMFGYGRAITSPEDLTFAIRRVKEIQSLVEQVGGVFFLAWPAFMDIEGDHEVGTYKNSSLMLQLIRDEFAKHDVQFLCEDSDAFFGPSAFLDTEYHLNAWGATLRSLRYARCLYDANLDTGFATQTAPQVINFETVRYFRNQRGAELLKWEIKLNDFQKLQAALQDFYKDHGYYPRSDGWMGISSKWGESTEEWIPGLAPRYISNLPLNPDRNRHGHYLYKSDGRDYKIIVHSQNDVRIMRALGCEAIDPVRKDTAFGVWTQAAERW